MLYHSIIFYTVVIPYNYPSSFNKSTMRTLYVNTAIYMSIDQCSQAYCYYIAIPTILYVLLRNVNIFILNANITCIPKFTHYHIHIPMLCNVHLAVYFIIICTVVYITQYIFLRNFACTDIL